MNSQHNASSSGSGSGGMYINNNNRSRSRSRSISRRQGSGSSGGGGGQSSLSTHIQRQMERPRRERDPTPQSSSAHHHHSHHHHGASMPNLNYYNGPQPPPPPSTLSSSPRRTSASSSACRTSSNNNTHIDPTNNNHSNSNSSSPPFSCEERAAIAANLAKSSFSAHRNLQKLIDEQREREQRMEHAQHHHPHQQQHQQQQQKMQMQVYHPQHQQQQIHPQQQQQSCQLRRGSASSVAAVQQQPPPQHTPLKQLIGHVGFHRLGTHGSAVSSLSTFTSSPSTSLATVMMTPSTNPIATPPSLNVDYTSQLQRAASMPGGNISGYHNPQLQQRRSSISPRKQQQQQQHRDRLNTISRFPNLNEEDQAQQRQTSANTIITSQPDLELAQSIEKIVAFQKRNSTPCPPSSSGVQQFKRSFSHGQNVSSDANAAQQQKQLHGKSRSLLGNSNTPSAASSAQQQQRRNKTQSDYEINCKSRSFHSNSTAPTTASSLESGSLFTSPKSPHIQSQQVQQQQTSTPRYIDKGTLHNHLLHAPRESRVQMTRLVENLQNENQRLHVVNSGQVKQINNLEAEVGNLLRELFRYRRGCGEVMDNDSVAAGVGGGGDGSEVGDVSSPPLPLATTTPPSSRQRHSSSKVQTDRQDNTTTEQQLVVVRPYVKSKSLHEEVLDRRRSTTANNRRPSAMPLRNSITSAPDVTRTSIEFDDNIRMLKQLQLTTPSSPSNGDLGGDNIEFLRRNSSVSTTSTQSGSPEDICCSDSHTADASMLTADESIFETSVIARQRSFKEEKKADTHATSRWSRRFSEIKDVADPQSDSEGSINEEEMILIQQQLHEENHQDEASRQRMLKSNSLEDIYAPQKRRSVFVEQKGSSTTGSVPSMTETVGSWSCSASGSGRK